MKFGKHAPQSTELTDREQRAVDLYTRSLNKAQSYQLAGYKDRRSYYKFFEQAKIKQAISRSMAVVGASKEAFEPEEQPEQQPEREKDWAREFNPPMGPYLGNWARDGKLHNPPTGVCAWIAGSEAPWVFAGEEDKRQGPVSQLRRIPTP